MRLSTLIGPRLLAYLLLLCWILPAAGAAPAMAAKEDKPIRAAILRFSAPADDQQLVNYAQGATQTLISAFSHIPRFVVVHEVWVENVLADHGVQFAGGGRLDEEMAQKVGTWLEAQVLITGYLLRSGGQVRMTANVTDLVTGQTEVEQLTGSLDRIFDLMDNLSRRVLASQKVILTPEERERLAQSVRPTAKLTAFEYYARGQRAYQLATPVGFKDAIDWFQKAIDQDQSFAQAYAGLGDAYSSWGWQRKTNGQDYETHLEKALEYATKAVKLRPELLEGHRALAHVYQNLGRLYEAQTQVYLALAINLNDAESLYRLWRLTNPDNPDDSNLLSALSLDPGLIVAHNDRGIAYMKQGNLEAAIREYQAVLKVVPRKANTHYNLGLVYKKQQRWTDALAEFKLASEITPDDPDSQYELGILYLERKQLPDALAALQQAVNLAPKDHQMRLGLGRVFLEQNQLELALAEFQQARRLSSDDPRVYFLLGEAFSKKGHNEEAARAYERCLMLQPDYPDGDQIRKKIQQLRKSKGA